MTTIRGGTDIGVSDYHIDRYISVIINYLGENYFEWEVMRFMQGPWGIDWVALYRLPDEGTSWGLFPVATR